MFPTDTFSTRTVNISSAAWADMPPMNSSSVASTDILFDMVGLFLIPLNGRTAQLRLRAVGPAWVRQIEVEHFQTAGRAPQPLSGAGERSRGVSDRAGWPASRFALQPCPRPPRRRSS